MPTIQEMKVISTPMVYVNGDKIGVVPNSVKFNIPGETSVRAISYGGGQVKPVVGQNAEMLKGKVSFGVPATQADIEIVRTWRAMATAGESVAIRIVDNTGQYAYQHMYMTSEVEVPLEQDGTLDVEFEGSHVE